jgi:cardiolipin synthase A/B
MRRESLALGPMHVICFAEFPTAKETGMALALDETAKHFAQSGSYPVRTGNHVRPLVDGKPAFRRICDAIDAAKKSVWVTVAFIHQDFEMPDGRGSLFDVLDAAQARGLDVRALFWRINDVPGFDSSVVFSGDAAHREMLAQRGSKFLARWDRAYRNYCQHQKSWIVDAGHDTEVAFVGGINLGRDSVVSPGHDLEDHPHTHDIYLELQGPSATDVHHNFVQRWNEASDRDLPDGAWPDRVAAGVLDFPMKVSPGRGSVVAQVQRTVRRDLYTDGTATPGGERFDIAAGELSCFEQYERAIANARSYIYFENQALGQPETVEALHEALKRGVVVTVLVPADPNEFMAAARKDPRSQPFFERLGALGDHPHFLLAGIARRTPGGDREHIYVHAKAGVVDDRWVTIGSCNIGARSFFGDTELNVSFVCDDHARAFRTELFKEHLGVDTASTSGIEACKQYQAIARENALALAKGSRPEGLVFALDPKTYGS